MSLADHALPTPPEPALQKIAQSTFNDTTQSVHIKEERLCPVGFRRWVWVELFVVYKTYEYVLFNIFFAESLTATHPGGSEVKGSF